jgi:hypothetical protein
MQMQGAGRCGARSRTAVRRGRQHELADARRERDAARGAAAAAEARLADMEQLQRDKAAALRAVQRLEVGAAASAASLAAARSQVPRGRPAGVLQPAKKLSRDFFSNELQISMCNFESVCPETDCRSACLRCALWSRPCHGAGDCVLLIRVPRRRVRAVSWCRLRAR